MGLASDHAGLELKRAWPRSSRSVASRCRTSAPTRRPPVTIRISPTRSRAPSKTAAWRGACSVCGTGVGMSIAANRHAGRACRGVQRAAERTHVAPAQRRQRACVSVRAWSARDTALDILDAFVEAEFEGGRHAGSRRQDQPVRQVASGELRGTERSVSRCASTCEHCTYFHVERERCMHGYPNAEHREDATGSAQPAGAGRAGRGSAGVLQRVRAGLKRLV